MSECRTCRAPILWVQTERGKTMPVDLDPYAGDDPRGLFVLHVNASEGLEKVVAIATTPDAADGRPVYRSHFATCPHAEAHRR